MSMLTEKTAKHLGLRLFLGVLSERAFLLGHAKWIRFPKESVVIKEEEYLKKNCVH